MCFQLFVRLISYGIIIKASGYLRTWLNIFLSQVGSDRNSKEGPLLVVKNLCKKFGNKVVLNSLCLSIDCGQIYGLIGKNSVGKTTLMRILSGEIDKSSGTVLMDNAEIGTFRSTTFPPVVYCPQNNPLWPEITLREHLNYFCAIQGIPSNQIDAFCQRLLSMLNIEEHEATRARYLSGGTKRKVIISAYCSIPLHYPLICPL